MKRIAQIAGLALLGLSIGFCFGQSTSTKAAASVLPSAPTPQTNFYAAGASYSVNSTPGVAGTALQAHLLADTGTYEFAVVDALPQSVSPFTVNTNVGIGIAQKLTSFKIGSENVDLFVPTAAGISWSGTNTGWQWNGGVLAAFPIKTSGYYLMPSVRFLKSSVSNGSGYQPIVGLMIGRFF